MTMAFANRIGLVPMPLLAQGPVRNPLALVSISFHMEFPDPGKE